MGFITIRFPSSIPRAQPHRDLNAHRAPRAVCHDSSIVELESVPPTQPYVTTWQ